jgi:large subunit ribosomal protein L20
MTRIKRGVNAHRRHRKVIKAAKGMRGLRGVTFKASKNAVMKAGQNAYIGRRLKKRTFRQLWIARINAACRPLGITYSRLIAAMTLKGVLVNRKMLSELAIHHPEAFKAVVDSVK